MTDNALIVGAGPGMGTSLARTFADAGYRLALVRRNPEPLADLAAELGAQTFACDVADPEAVQNLFARLDDDGRSPDLMVYNAGYYTRGPIAELDPAEVHASIAYNAWGACLVAQQAARRMVPRQRGVMMFTGASAGLKGYAGSAPFAMGKFALRGLCQSLARELSPKNIHVAHIVIDGIILQPSRGAPYDDPETTLDPEEIARTYLELSRQHRSAWTSELELRPSVETF